MAECSRCHGLGVVECFSCKEGYEIGQFQNHRTCPYCHGIKTHWSQGNYCHSCSGTGVYADKVPCRQCHGSRRCTCLVCHGAGQI